MDDEMGIWMVFRLRRKDWKNVVVWQAVWDDRSGSSWLGHWWWWHPSWMTILLYGMPRSLQKLYICAEGRDSFVMLTYGRVLKLEFSKRIGEVMFTFQNIQSIFWIILTWFFWVFATWKKKTTIKNERTKEKKNHLNLNSQLPKKSCADDLGRRDRS